VSGRGVVKWWEKKGERSFWLGGGGLRDEVDEFIGRTGIGLRNIRWGEGKG